MRISINRENGELAAKVERREWKERGRTDGRTGEGEGGDNSCRVTGDGMCIDQIVV